MNIYWTWKSFPELRDLEPSRRKIVWRACWLRPFLHWQTWVAFLNQFVFVFLGAAIGSFIDGWHRIWLAIYLDGSVAPSDLEHLRLPIWTAVFFWLGSFPGAFFFTQVYSRKIRPYLKRFVESHKVT